jgi:hypothetical protein
MHWKLDNQQKDGIITILSSVRTFIQIFLETPLYKFDPMQSQGQDK